MWNDICGEDVIPEIMDSAKGIGPYACLGHVERLRAWIAWWFYRDYRELCSTLQAGFLIATLVLVHSFTAEYL